MTKTPHQWLIAFTRLAVQELRQLPSQDRMAVFRVLRNLLQADNPLAAHGVKKLKGALGHYRARVGDYRILFDVTANPTTHLKRQYKGTLTVEVIRHRSRAYRP